ncbi:MAG: STAS domain-containing protein [Xanthomonadaceae bacterium]|jgi:phospholipid transport system transporter-binding protein|nr:STAS domain-containing protein [Xanthomonadaceae bacterium]
MAIELNREGASLALTGSLDREAVIRLWPTLRQTLAGVRQLHIDRLRAIDSAGLALLAVLAGQARDSASGQAPLQIIGEPAGMAELRAAYRLEPTLDFARSTASKT